MAVRVYFYQLLQALVTLEKSEIIHSDIKPDNILVADNNNVVKLADFGSSFFVYDQPSLEYIGSRFYRAPETSILHLIIVLGIENSYSLDLWALACSMYELYTGQVLFPGNSNNHMLELIMEKFGKLPHKLLKRGRFLPNHFDSDDNYAFIQEKSGKKIYFSQTISFSQNFFSHHPHSLLDDSFIDLLTKCLHVNPSKRISPLNALKHDFFRI